MSLWRILLHRTTISQIPYLIFEREWDQTWRRLCVTRCRRGVTQCRIVTVGDARVSVRLGRPILFYFLLQYSLGCNVFQSNDISRNGYCVLTQDAETEIQKWKLLVQMGRGYHSWYRWGVAITLGTSGAWLQLSVQIGRGYHSWYRWGIAITLCTSGAWLQLLVHEGRGYNSWYKWGVATTLGTGGAWL